MLKVLKVHLVGGLGTTRMLDYFMVVYDIRERATMQTTVIAEVPSLHAQTSTIRPIDLVH